MNETATCSVANETLNEVKQAGRWMLLKGILLIILGIIGLGAPYLFTIAGVLVFGILITIAGVAQIVYSFSSKSTGRIILNLLIGLLYLWGGITAIIKPEVMSLVLTYVIACVILAAGVVRIIQALQHRGVRGWGWLLVSGVLAVLLGLIIVIEWPESELWVIGLFISIELLFNGIASIGLSLAVRTAGELVEKAAQERPAPEPEPGPQQPAE
jgi:uncharacterized membrane protein HdeD (DUF308 family)